MIVDAVFLHSKERAAFRKLADTRQTAFIILECVADVETLRQRIIVRKNDVSDADLKVLDMQCSEWQPLGEDERINTLTVDTGAPADIDSLVSQIKKSSSL